MTITLAQLQEEQVPWVKHNFGDRPIHQPLLGVIEEIGELTEMLDMFVRGGGPKIFDEIKDALADITVFLCDYASAVGWSMETVEKEAKALSLTPEYVGIVSKNQVLHRMMIAAGKTCHHHLKCEQGIRGNSDEHRQKGFQQAVMVIANVMSMCLFFGLNFQVACSEVWAEVKKRDWKKNSVSAHEDANA